MDQMRASGPPSGALEIDVERLDASVEEAIRVGAPHGLRVLSYGELTVVIGSSRKLASTRGAAPCGAIGSPEMTAVSPITRYASTPSAAK